MYSIFKNVKRAIEWGVIATIAWMVIIAALNLLLRWLFDKNLSWADIQLRQMVLIIALLGGILAAANDRHIKIDLMEYLLSKKLRRIVKRLVSIIAAASMFFLAYVSISFIKSDYQLETTLRDFLFGVDVQQWIIELLIPVSFSLMGLFFLFNSLAPDLKNRLEGDND